MAEFDFEEFEALNNNIFTGQEEISAREYYKVFSEGIKRNVDRNLFPRNYKYPVGVQFELTYKCNQKCIHCYNQSGGVHDEREMNIEEWKNLANRVGEIGVFQCIISGGEPTLLGEGLFEILDILNNYNIEIVLISNGLRLDKSYVKKLKKYKYTWFQISIDGSRPEIHDYIRGVSCWSQAIKAANYVKQAGLPLVISHAIVKKNYPYIEEMIELAYTLGAKRIVTGPFSYAGRAVLNVDGIELTKAEKLDTYDRLRKLRKKYKGRMEIATAMEEPLGLRVKQSDVNGGLLIRPNGDVKIDCVTPFKIGNILEEDLLDMWNRIGRDVWEHDRVREYIDSIRTAEDLLTSNTRINVDDDELLV